MKLTTVLFDLDGTLLPMDTDRFMELYIGAIGRKTASAGLDPKKVIDALWAGTASMIKNNGSHTNQEVFWETFEKVAGGLEAEAVLEDFYQNEFECARASTRQSEKVPALIRKLKEAGLRLAVATNPLFPAVAIHRRMDWAGVDPQDFEHITTYESSHFCKPNPEYYREILTGLNLQPRECLMVGNDADEDTVAAQLGMRVFLVTDCLLNRSGKDISAFPQGSFDALWEYIQKELAE